MDFVKGLRLRFVKGLRLGKPAAPINQEHRMPSPRTTSILGGHNGRRRVFPMRPCPYNFSIRLYNCNNDRKEQPKCARCLLSCKHRLGILSFHKPLPTRLFLIFRGSSSTDRLSIQQSCRIGNMLAKSLTY